MCIATAILNVLTYTVIVVSFLLKNQTLAYAICTFLAMAGTTIGGFVMIARNRKSNKVRYFMMIGLFVITAMLIYGFSDYYMRFLAAMPFIGCVLFFDTRFFKIASIVISVENIGMTLLREFVLKDYGEEEFLANIVAALAASVMMFVLWYVTKVGKDFNSDSLGQVQANAQNQKVMLDDVMQIADKIRSGADGAKDVLSDLQESSKIVNQSVNDISDSTNHTAESIQSQSQMTNDIQNQLEQTVSRMEHMVRVAQYSKELNEESAKQMRELQREAEESALINVAVTESMRQLQGNVENVKAITQTIFDISSQTNLLALNAAIESAHAGEADFRCGKAGSSYEYQCKPAGRGCGGNRSDCGQSVPCQYRDRGQYFTAVRIYPGSNGGNPAVRFHDGGELSQCFECTGDIKQYRTGFPPDGQVYVRECNHAM